MQVLFKANKLNCFYNNVKNNEGQAIVELVLILPLFFMMMMFLIIVYGLINKSIDSEHKVRYKFRLATEMESRNECKSVIIRDTAQIKVPGKMKNILGQSIIKNEIKLYGYVGCYQGTGKSKFKSKYLYRSINK